MNTLIRGCYFIIFFVILFESSLVFQKMKTRTHYYLFMNCISMLICCIGTLVMSFCSNDETYFYGLVYSWGGRILVIVSTFYFIITHCNYKIPKAVTVVESVLSAVLFAIILTTRKTGLFYKDYRVDFSGEINVIHYSKGPFGILWAINVLSILIICIFALHMAISTEKSVRRKKQYKLIIGALASEFVVGFLASTPAAEYFDFNLVGFAVCAIIIMIATFANNLLDMETATKDYIVDELSSGVVVVDQYGDIAYYNRMIGNAFPFIQSSPKDALDHIHWLIEKNQLLKVEDKSYRFEEKQLEDASFKDMKIYAMTDVTAYYNHLKDVERQKEIADEANKLKSYFLAGMSHEIRTPINTVLGMDEMILLENKDPEINKYAKLIQSAGKTLLGIINDILDFSKIEAGKIEIIPVKYDFLELLNEIVTPAISFANDKGLSFETDIDPEIPRYLLGDETRIKQCIVNLFTNAIKYTEKGKVCFSVHCSKVPASDNVALSISVKDTGIGIRAEDMDKLFSAFDRLDVVRNRSIKGTGLGLPITKQFIEKMGSELCVESEYDKGSTFSFLLNQKVSGKGTIGEFKIDGMLYAENEKSRYTVETFYAPSASVLVVDDTENNLFVFESLLKRTGLDIETVTSAKHMLRKVRERKYDIIYLDHMMPEMDGIEALHAMKELEENKNEKTPVIALTANAIYGSRDYYLGEGFTDYMSKPVSYANLKASLEKYLPVEKQSHSEPIVINQGEEEAEILNDELAAYEGRGIDLKAGLENSGTGEILLKVIKDFREGIDDTAATIENELKNRELKNYTIHVHALKSSARLIGALRLSSMAINLENSGNEYMKAVSAGNSKKAVELLADIEELTPDLLEYLRSYKDLLNVDGADESRAELSEELPMIGNEELEELLAAIKEAAQAFDMDTMDAAMDSLEKYSVPDDKKELVEELKKAVRNINYDSIISLLSGV